MEIARPENPRFNLSHSWLWTPARERKGCHCRCLSLSVFIRMYLCMYFTLTNPFRLPAILNDDSCCSAGDYIIYIRIFLPSTLHYLCTYTLYKLEISIEEIQLLLLAHQPKSLVHMPLPSPTSPPAHRTARGQTTSMSLPVFKLAQLLHNSPMRSRVSSLRPPSTSLPFT